MKIFDAGQLTLRDAAKSLFLSSSGIVAKENGSVRVFADELTSFATLYYVNIENFLMNS